MPDMPFINVEYHAGNYLAIVAAQILPKSLDVDSPLTSLNANQQIKEHIRHVRIILQNLSNSSLITSVALRYFYIPSNVGSTNFQIFCLLRVDANSDRQARQRAKDAWSEFIGTFPLKLYDLIAIADSTWLSDIYSPHEFNHPNIVEMRKLEDVVPTKYVMAGEYYYSVCPINSIYTPMEDVLEPIVRHNTPFILNICLWPTHLTNDEEHIVGSVVGQLHKFATGFSTRMLSATWIAEPDKNAETCLQRYINLLDNAQNLFQFRVQLASPQPIPRHLSSAISVRLSKDHQIEVVTDEFAVDSYHTFRYLDPRAIWGGSQIWDMDGAPSPLRRISYLISIDEALQLFRLPIIFHKGITSTIIYTKEIKHVGDKKFTIRGDVNAPVIANFDHVFGNISQTLKDSPISQRSDFEELLDLISGMQNALQNAPSSNSNDIELVTNRLQKIADELKSDTPMKDDLEYHGRKLVEAAEKLKDTVPIVLQIAKQILKFVITFSV